MIERRLPCKNGLQGRLTVVEAKIHEETIDVMALRRKGTLPRRGPRGEGLQDQSRVDWSEAPRRLYRPRQEGTHAGIRRAFPLLHRSRDFERAHRTGRGRRIRDPVRARGARRPADLVSTSDTHPIGASRLCPGELWESGPGVGRLGLKVELKDSGAIEGSE